MNKLLPAKKGFGAFFLIFNFVAFSFGQKETGKFSTEDDIKQDLKLNVCENKERLDAVKKLFKKMGASEDEIKIEKFKNVENLIVVKKGKTEETVVVGAHYDKTSDGCGAIDNWTGVVIIANLYRTLKQFSTEKTYVFVAFGKEELGLVGSDAMAKEISKDKRQNYCAMVNLDSFGLAYPQVMTNTSDAKLIDLAKAVAKDMKLPFAQASIELASADSESFRRQKIPAVSIHGLSNKWQEYLHQTRDKLDNVNPQSVYIGYRYSLAYLSRIDENACGAFRK